MSPQFANWEQGSKGLEQREGQVWRASKGERFEVWSAARKEKAQARWLNGVTLGSPRDSLGFSVLDTKSKEMQNQSDHFCWRFLSWVVVQMGELLWHGNWYAERGWIEPFPPSSGASLGEHEGDKTDLLRGWICSFHHTTASSSSPLSVLHT